jgi:putative transposase
MGSTLTNLLYHIVFSTKNRSPSLSGELQSHLYQYIGGIIREKRGYLLEAGGTADHLHLLARFPPTISISEMQQNIKGSSSGWVNREHKTDAHFGWQDGYAAFSVSPSKVPAVSRYIKNQEAHHRRTTFKVELIKLLEKHEVEYDERYVFS